MSKSRMKVIADFSITPIGHGSTSIGREVASAICAIADLKGVKYEVTPMGTVIEADDLDSVFKAVKAAHEVLFAMGVKRVESNLRIDDRRDKPRTMKDKLASIRKYMEQPPG